MNYNLEFVTKKLDNIIKENAEYLAGTEVLDNLKFLHTITKLQHSEHIQDNMVWLKQSYDVLSKIKNSLSPQEHNSYSYTIGKIKDFFNYKSPKVAKVKDDITNLQNLVLKVA